MKPNGYSKAELIAISDMLADIAKLIDNNTEESRKLKEAASILNMLAYE